MDANNDKELSYGNWQYRLLQEQRSINGGRLARKDVKGKNEKTPEVSVPVPSHDANEAIAYYKYICTVMKDFPSEGKQHVVENLEEFGLTGEYAQDNSKVNEMSQLYLSHTGRSGE